MFRDFCSMDFLFVMTVKKKLAQLSVYSRELTIPIKQI